jgi:hypothetical protein
LALGTLRVSWPNMTASSIAPTPITASVTSELVPAPASTAGIANIPVPMMLPITSPVAEVMPMERAFSLVFDGVIPGGPSCAPPRGSALAGMATLATPTPGG